MSENTQVQLFNAFLGTQEGIHSIILADIFSPGGSANLFIDKYGRARKISGYSKINSTPVTTDTGGSATMVRGLFAYRGTAGGTVTRKLIGVFDDNVNEWEIWVSTNEGVTWTGLLDLGSTVVGQLPDFAQFGDTLFITSGKISAKYYDGTTAGTAGQTQSSTPSGSVTGTGILKGIYRYKLVARYDTDRRKPGSASSGQLTPDNQKVSLTWSADANTSVVGYEVYRTVGNGSIFYFVAYVNGRTTVAYTDNIPDSSLLSARALEEHGDPPPVTYFCEPHKQRMWWGRSDTYPTRAWWSDVGTPDSVYVENFLDFSDSDTQGDHLTGLVGNVGNQLVVLTEKAVWTVTGTGAVVGDILDWNRNKSNAQTGCVTHRSVVKVPKGARYMSPTGEVRETEEVSLAYFTPLGDIRLFDGENDLVISHAVKDTLIGFNYAGRTKVHAVHDPDNANFVWFFPSGSALEADTAVAWNYRWGVWYVWNTMPFACCIDTESASDASTLIAGSNSTSTGGYVYHFFSGNSFDGSPIPAKWMTKAFRGQVGLEASPALAYTKRWRWADLLFEVNNDVSLTLEWVAGSAPDNAVGVGTVVVSPAGVTLISSSSDFIVSADGDPISTAISSAQVKKLLKDTHGDYLHDEGIRLRISDNASAGSWALEAFSVAYQVLPGLFRRDQ